MIMLHASFSLYIKYLTVFAEYTKGLYRVSILFRNRARQMFFIFRKKTPRAPKNWYRTPDSNSLGLVNNTLLPSTLQQPIDNQCGFYINNKSLHIFDVKQLKKLIKKPPKNSYY